MNTTNAALRGQVDRGSLESPLTFLSGAKVDVHHETDLQGEVGDFITIVTSKSPLLTKTWEADGSITGHGRAKQHTVRTVPVNGIRGAAEVFAKLRNYPTSGIVRGAYIGDEAAALVPDPDGEREAGYVLRQMPFFTDPAHHLILLDIDGYVPLLADPVDEPEAAIREWVRFNLPPEFQGVSCWWHLSSSAGHPSKAGTLRAHLMFWLDRKLTSPEAAAYVTMARIQVDRAPLHVIQLNYTADPVFAPGVVDPVTHRAGLLEGPHGDVVELELDESALAVAVLEMRRGTQTSGGGEGGVCLDPRQKKGLVGAFCRAFSVEDVLMAEWFPGSFERVTERRYTWLDGGGSAEGAFITEDRQRLTNTHDSSPCNTIGRGLNAYDLTRVYKFGHLDDAATDEERRSWESYTLRPSEVAMRHFARNLAEVVTQVDVALQDNPFEADDVEELLDDSPNGSASGVCKTPREVKTSSDDRHCAIVVDKIEEHLRALRMTKDEIERAINKAVLSAAWCGCFAHTKEGKIYLLNSDGELTLYNERDAAKQVSIAFGSLLNQDVVSEVAQKQETDTAAISKLRREINQAAFTEFHAYLKHFRQRDAMHARVDMFAVKSGVRMLPDEAEVTYRHKPFPTVHIDLPNGVETDDIVAEYRKHFPFFETILDLLLHARFATDRRQAFLWLQCRAGWGKGFLLDGVLGKDGLKVVTGLAVSDIERAFSGQPTGVTESSLVRAWVLWFDEFKTVKSELKQLNNSITASPKGKMRFTSDVFLKLFTSVEDVGSLGGYGGVEQQFADRFALHSIPSGPSIDDLPRYALCGKKRYRTVLANYSADFLNAGVERMRLLGRYGSSKAADEWLAQFHKDHGICNTHGLLGDTLPELADEVRDLVKSHAHPRLAGVGPDRISLEGLSRELRSQLERNVRLVKGSRSKPRAQSSPELLVVVSNLSDLVEEFINSNVGASRRVMVRHKTGDIARLVAGIDDTDGGLKNPRLAFRYYTVDDTGEVKEHSPKNCAILTLLEHEALLAMEEVFQSGDERKCNVVALKR